jgi:predicted nucleic acid-binding protein
MDVLVDTNILIDYSKGYSEDFEILLERQYKGEIHILINPVVVMEYLIGVSDNEIDIALSFLTQFDIVDINFRMGISASRLVQGKHVSFWKDALIVASCIDSDAMLATKNKKHFKDIKGLQLYEL